MEDVVMFYAIRCILRPFCVFYDHLVYFVTIWYICAVLLCCNQKNLATLEQIEVRRHLVEALLTQFAIRSVCANGEPSDGTM
jgi:hypothetical protein